MRVSAYAAKRKGLAFRPAKSARIIGFYYWRGCGQIIVCANPKSERSTHSLTHRPRSPDETSSLLSLIKTPPLSSQPQPAGANALAKRKQLEKATVMQKASSATRPSRRGMRDVSRLLVVLARACIMTMNNNSPLSLFLSRPRALFCWGFSSPVQCTQYAAASAAPL